MIDGLVPQNLCAIYFQVPASQTATLVNLWTLKEVINSSNRFLKFFLSDKEQQCGPIRVHVLMNNHHFIIPTWDRKEKSELSCISRRMCQSLSARHNFIFLALLYYQVIYILRLVFLEFFRCHLPSLG